MVYLLVVILDDLKRLPDLLNAWQSAGVPGVTLLSSAGGYRATSWLDRVGLRAIDRLFESGEVQRRTLLVVVEGEELLEKAIGEAERVLDGFDRPNSGLLLVMPVAQIRGLHKARPKAAEQALPPAVRPDWAALRDMPVERAMAILDLRPAIVQPELTLEQVAQAMVAHPEAQVACVVAADGRLVGVLDLRALVEDLFFHILPEEFMSEITDLEELMAFAEKSRMRTAGDAMQEPVWVKPDETLRQAFERMHESRLPGLPVVDNRYHVIGYVNLLELLFISAGQERPSAAEGES